MMISCVTQKPAFQLKAAFATSGHHTVASHAQQIIAAALGYNSLAHLQKCEAGSNADAMAEAQAIILCKSILENRLLRFGIPASVEMLELIRSELQEAWREHFENSRLTLWWRLSDYLDHLELYEYDPEEHFSGWLADSNSFVEGAWLSLESSPEPGPGPLSEVFDAFPIDVEMDLDADPERMLTTAMADYYTSGFEGSVTARATRYGPRGITFLEIESEDY